jgi:hypothetical protein
MNIEEYIQQINNIYNLINNFFVNEKKETNVVLTGSSSILYYLYFLGYDNLLNYLNPPNDIDFIVTYKGKLKPCINNNILDTYMNDINIKFDIIFVPYSSIYWNKINNINIIDLKDLLDFYNEDKDLPQRNDNIKIEIIQEILNKLLINPQEILKYGKIHRDKETKYNITPIKLDFCFD